MPPEWEAVLKTSSLKKDEIIQHPQAVIDVLTFQQRGPTGKAVPSTDNSNKNNQTNDQQEPEAKSESPSFSKLKKSQDDGDEENGILNSFEFSKGV